MGLSSSLLPVVVASSAFLTSSCHELDWLKVKQEGLALADGHLLQGGVGLVVVLLLVQDVGRVHFQFGNIHRVCKITFLNDMKRESFYIVILVFKVVFTIYVLAVERCLAEVFPQCVSC